MAEQKSLVYLRKPHPGWGGCFVARGGPIHPALAQGGYKLESEVPCVGTGTAFPLPTHELTVGFAFINWPWKTLVAAVSS